MIDSTSYETDPPAIPVTSDEWTLFVEGLTTSYFVGKIKAILAKQKSPAVGLALETYADTLNLSILAFDKVALSASLLAGKVRAHRQVRALRAVQHSFRLHYFDIEDILKGKEVSKED